MEAAPAAASSESPAGVGDAGTIEGVSCGRLASSREQPAKRAMTNTTSAVVKPCREQRRWDGRKRDDLPCGRARSTACNGSGSYVDGALSVCVLRRAHREPADIR